MTISVLTHAFNGAAQDDTGEKILREFRAVDSNVGARKTWLVRLADARDEPPRVTIGTTPEGLEGIEEAEARAWYFVAPNELLGSWAEAYGGERLLCLKPGGQNRRTKQKTLAGAAAC